MKTKIGGQAVIEGVMMRGAKSMALSVRDEAGNIRVEATRLKNQDAWYKKVPFLRGVISLFVSMVSGFKIISKSAEIMVAGELDSEEDGMGWLMTISVLLGLALAVGLFVLLPTYLAGIIMPLFGEDIPWLKSLLEGVFKMLVLIGYMAGISMMKDIRRVFMYHGAEHKTIACYESELPLTVENVQKCSRYHDRCGTSFIVFVLVLSVALGIVFDVICYAAGYTVVFDKGYWWLRSLYKLAMLPLTAGISYEMLMLLARSNFVLFRPLKWLGKQFQKITTREPSDDMCEVAITSFNKVLEMDTDETVPEQYFPAPVPLKQFKEQVKPLVNYSTMEGCDLDWILCCVLKVERNKLDDDIPVPFGWQIRIESMIKRCASGEPLQYVLGDTEFYGRTFALDNSVLIPRPETELVAEQLIKNAKKGATVLDLCCGSGVLGITAALELQAKVTMADVSKQAIKVAKYNAKKLKAKAHIVQSDMFGNVNGKFDAIVSNPPYIETDVIETLDDKVKNYEPHIALDGGSDGLKFYRIIAEQAPAHLNAKGLLVLEIGYNQGEAVAELLKKDFDVTVMKDYDGNDRIVVARLK